MIVKYTDNFGGKWITCANLVQGDFGGTGIVGHSNLRWLTAQGNVCEVQIYADSGVGINSRAHTLRIPRPLDFSAIILKTRTYNWQQGFVRVNGAQADEEIKQKTYILGGSGLVYDDPTYRRCCAEWEREAWDSYVFAALGENITEKLTRFITDYFSFDTAAEDNFYWSAYRAAVETCGVQIAYDNYAAIVPLSDCLQEMFVANVKAAMRDIYRVKRKAWRKDWLTLPS